MRTSCLLMTIHVYLYINKVTLNSYNAGNFMLFGINQLIFLLLYLYENIDKDQKYL